MGKQGKIALYQGNCQPRCSVWSGMEPDFSGNLNLTAITMQCQTLITKAFLVVVCGIITSQKLRLSTVLESS